MAIVPDTKDWTWVLERRCPECGYDAADVTVAAIAPLIGEVARQWGPILTDGSTDVRRRPGDERWSTLEYGCHVRDVFRLFDARLHLILEEDDPTFANWDQDATAVEERYGEQDPDCVARELLSAADRLAASFAAVPTGSWTRTGTRGDGARFTVESFGRYLLHDPIHHLHDVGAARPRG